MERQPPLTIKMKIVHLIFNFRIGGMETMLVDIMNHQAEAGHDLVLMLINDDHDSSLISMLDKRIEIVCLHRNEGSHNPVWFWRVNRAISKLRPDIVHSHNVMALGYLFPKRSYRLVFTHHTTGVGHINYLRKADCQVAISKAVADDVAARLGFECQTIMNGIPFDAIVQRDRRPLDPDKGIRILQLGRLRHAVKGQHLTLKALSILKSRYNLHVDFIGDGPFRNDIENIAHELGVADMITFFGAVRRDLVFKQICGYDIVVLPSLQEGFGLTLAEAMAAGVPVIASDLPGPLEVLDGGHLGETFPSGDADALARAIADTIDSYPERLEKAQGPAREFARQFSIGNTAENYLKLYRSLL